MSGTTLAYIAIAAGVLILLIVLHLLGYLRPILISVRDLCVVVVAFVVTEKFWRSICLGLIAITFPLLPFLWRLLGHWLSTIDESFWTMSLGAAYLDEWLVGVLSVGVIAAANWVESWFDFRLNFWSGFFTFLAGFGAFLFLAGYGVVHNSSSVILANPTAHASFISTTYTIGVGIILASFLSIGETRRAKDLWGAT
jgi:hypothetical protein